MAVDTLLHSTCSVGNTMLKSIRHQQLNVCCIDLPTVNKNCGSSGNSQALHVYDRGSGAHLGSSSLSKLLKSLLAMAMAWLACAWHGNDAQALLCIERWPLSKFDIPYQAWKVILRFVIVTYSHNDSGRQYRALRASIVERPRFTQWLTAPYSDPRWPPMPSFRCKTCWIYLDTCRQCERQNICAFCCNGQFIVNGQFGPYWLCAECVIFNS